MNNSVLCYVMSTGLNRMKVLVPFTCHTVFINVFLQHLEESVNSGLISRHENKGNISYKDPESCPRGGNSKGLKLSPTCDLTKVIFVISSMRTFRIFYLAFKWLQ